MTSFLIVLSLMIVAPRDGEVVPTQKDAQKAYLSAARSERAMRMGNRVDREKLLKIGSAQRPLRVAWTGGTNAVYLLTVDYGEGGAREVFAVTNRTQVWLTNLELSQNYTLKVEREGAPGDSALVRFTTESDAPRFLKAEGVYNFRDCGGWRTDDGHRIKENMIFRSAGLRASSRSEGGLFSQRTKMGAQRVTDAGIATLKRDFKIRTDLELRAASEIAGMEGSLLAPEAQWKTVSFAAYDQIGDQVKGREPFAKVFALFSDRSSYPILMHCSAGADRTGTLTFLLNGLLGISEEDLRRDWESSTFSNGDIDFSSVQIQRLVDYLNTFRGKTMQERIESYVKSCGIPAEQIAAFRKIMID